MSQGPAKEPQKGLHISPVQWAVIGVIAIGTLILLLTATTSGPDEASKDQDSTVFSVAELLAEEKIWTAPEASALPSGEEGKQILYGKELLIHTSKYFGPNGKLDKSTNGLSCQSCHLDAGTRPFGNNLGAASTTYPRFLARTGHVVSLAGKVNECFSRSLNGSPIDTNSREMQAYVAYINWLGTTYHKKEKPVGSNGIKPPHFIDRAADPMQGKVSYDMYCARCHGAEGKGYTYAEVMKDITKQQGGTATSDDLFYYPPLWGDNSYNAVATLYRVSKLAGYIYNNMPYPTDYKKPLLTLEQAWDIAAYVNSQKRPVKDYSKDYISDISKKPYDFPFPPFSDGFTEDQHKYGPYQDMPSAQKPH